MKAMTKREFLNAVIATETISDELKDFAKNEIAHMDTSNASNRERSAVKRAEKRAEKAPIIQALYDLCDDTPKTASDLVAALGMDDVTVRHIPSLMKTLVDSGKVAKTPMKVEGKSRIAYTLRQDA